MRSSEAVASKCSANSGVAARCPGNGRRVRPELARQIHGTVAGEAQAIPGCQPDASVVIAGRWLQGGEDAGAAGHQGAASGGLICRHQAIIASDPLITAVTGPRAWRSPTGSA